MPSVRPILTPNVVLVARTKGTYGVGEVIALSCSFEPGATTIAAFGGALTWKVSQGTGAVSANNNLGQATYTAPDVASDVRLVITRNDTKAEVASIAFKVIAPNGVLWTKTGDLHTHGVASAGFTAAQRLVPSGVSFNNIEIREGSFKGKGSGSYAGHNNKDHATGAWGVGTVANGNQIAGFDTVNSGPIAAPYVAGTFEWYIPWQYRVLPAGTARTFEWITHKQDINAIGRVSITKGGITVAFSVNDP